MHNHQAVAVQVRSRRCPPEYGDSKPPYGIAIRSRKGGKDLRLSLGCRHGGAQMHKQGPELTGTDELGRRAAAEGLEMLR